MDLFYYLTVEDFLIYKFSKRMEKIPVTRFEHRIRSKAMAQEFFRKKFKLYLPDDKCFNTSFILKVLSGKKFLLPLTASSIIKLARSKNSDMFDKAKLLNLISSDSRMISFIPDEITDRKISREILLMIIDYVDHNKIEQLFSELHDKRFECQSSFKNKVKIHIRSEFLKELDNYESSILAPKSKTFLNIPKNY